MNHSWTPLFSSIVVSSIWGEDPATKVVWITMLAIKDKAGFVSASVPGLARLAVVSVEDCRRALDTLMAPDPDSKCRSNEGRRIKEVPGGWMVLNHELYQEVMHEISRKSKNAERQKRFRQSKASGRSEGELKGESEYVRAERNGASPEELDQIVSKSLPKPWRK